MLALVAYVYSSLCVKIHLLLPASSLTVCVELCMAYGCDYLGVPSLLIVVYPACHYLLVSLWYQTLLCLYDECINTSWSVADKTVFYLF